ncbi:DUF2484 family protein [Pseudoruegeria sp. HB172150]|uniref:DUF2484 family protein n=1 Tax=Pseudoruegeria sp. HB172150 TaxID=2721164 RepID=UPI0015524119|nr:DUF2484 family protein [Pseudoruegeria sp. HB172150]
MSLPLILGCFWAIAANVAGMLPSKRSHWPAAYVLIAVGLPILVWIFWLHGPWIGLLCLAAAMSILRWPVLYLWRWINRVLGTTERQ